MLIGIVGELGTGKTLTLTYLLLRDKIKYNRYIVTNYWTAFSDRIIRHPMDIEYVSDCSLGLDELWLWLDSRMTFSNTNRVLANILRRSRKVGVDVYFTTHNIRNIDYRLRQVVDLWVVPEYVSPDRCYYKIVDPINMVPLARKWFVPKYIFPLYDTEEIVEPIDYREVLEEIATDPEILEILETDGVDIAVAIAADKYPISKTILKPFMKKLYKKLMKSKKEDEEEEVEAEE